MFAALHSDASAFYSNGKDSAFLVKAQYIFASPQVLKPFSIAKKWAMRVTDEFFLQGDKEKSHGMPLTPMCDRNTQGRVALQKGFVDFVIGVSALRMRAPECAFVMVLP